MRITESSLGFSATHLVAQEKKVEESLTMIGSKRFDVAEQMRAFQQGADGKDAVSPVKISDAGRQNLQAETENRTNSIAELVENDPQLTLLRHVIEMFTGEKINLTDVALRDPGDASDVVVYQYHSSYTEAEATAFSANGTVRTADGREISFSLELSMFYSYHREEHVEIEMYTGGGGGNGSSNRKSDPLKDPLVLNFSGTAAALSDMTFKFDLMANGQEVNMRTLQSGSGYLVFDRNGDHEVNNGSELFGALTGNGFQELAALDDDNNGWIDENDAAFSQLYLWNNDMMISLKDAGVGAIALKYINTPFSLKDANNNLLGKIQSSGIFLNENGSVGSVQKIDVVV